MKFSPTFLQKIKQNGMQPAILGLLLLTAFLSPIVSSDGYAFSNTLAEKKNSPENKTLAAKANQDGSVRIIVRVKTTQPFQPMADTVSSPARAQMSQIASAQESVLRGLAGHKILNSYKFRYTPYLSMTVDSAALDALLASPDVQQVQEDTLSAPTLDLSVPRIGASTLHSSNIKGTGITIAVLDTGVDKTHPFLSGSVVSEACYSTNYLPYSSTTICPAGVTESTAVDSAMPYGGTCPTGECDHGTHVAGIAGGRQSISGSPGPGVAPEADIIAVQVFSRFDSEALCGVGKSPCALSYTTDQMKGLERIYALRDTYTIASVNMSLGGGQYSSSCDTNSLKASIDNLRAAGIATIIASGNNGYCGYISAPACISSAISVGATTDTDAVASYSNSAAFISLLAPGSTINSSIPSSSYASWNGTSMATPHVTGAWALLKQQNPTTTVTEILNSFQSTGLSVTDSKCTSTTKKRINVLEAANFMTTPSYTLNVNSSGASSVAITGNPVLYSGTTNYSESGIAPDTSITLTAPSTSGSATFNNWSGCDSTASTDCTVSMTTNKTVSANYTPDAIALHNGVTVSNLSGAQDDMLDYYITVPTGIRSLTVQIWGGSGDADLYVRYDSKPTLIDWDYRPYLTGNKENVFINTPQAGNWYISINGYAAFSGVSLKAKFAPSWSLFIPAILSKPQ
ncbi:MAG: S8 family serine peptidase [Proteobacteria bacterium]|nr:S8 family serine peptidase [Pseudomonadota bacterium]MBU1648114.1 S8 family serine peptidase [Pseudomonadota bacterium]MBU1986124.1 S8 family serine peptidase [Pseudomonadota bacterium]